ncbi:MAG: DUF805 domain-containing protein [Chlamydiia bacterium]|nr:DUF805 domain-containing protein [Chlamydiia bacterium]
MFQLYFECLTTKYCSFKGRATRKEYWSFSIFFFIFITSAPSLLFKFSSLGVPLGYLLNINPKSYYFIPVIIFYLILSLPSIAVTVRRLHDLNLSGGWMFFAFVPLVGWLFFTFYVPFLKGSKGENRYGPDPLEIPPQKNFSFKFFLRSISQRYGSFSRRADRVEFLGFFFYLVHIKCAYDLVFHFLLFAFKLNIYSSNLSLCLHLLFWIPAFAVFIRRLNQLNLSKWFLIAPLFFMLLQYIILPSPFSSFSIAKLLVFLLDNRVQFVTFLFLVIFLGVRKDKPSNSQHRVTV